VIRRTAFATALCGSLAIGSAHAQQAEHFPPARPPDGCSECDEPAGPQPTPVPFAAQPQLPPSTELYTVPSQKTLLERMPELALRFELGGVYTHALERNFGGARLDFEIGREGAHFAIGGRSGIEVGSTASGLSYERFSWGVGIDGRFGPVRIGLEPRVGGIIIQRASGNDALLDLLAAPTIGLHAEVIVALYGAGNHRSRDHMALDLILRGGYDRMDVTHGNFDAANTAQVKLGLGGRY